MMVVENIDKDVTPKFCIGVQLGWDPVTMKAITYNKLIYIIFTLHEPFSKPSWPMDGEE